MSQARNTYVAIAVAAFVVVIGGYIIILAESTTVDTQTNVAAQVNPAKTSAVQYIPQSENVFELNATGGETTLTVVGLGYVNLAPDMASINLGFDTIAPTAQEAVQTNSGTMNRILLSMKAFGLEEKEVKTSYFSVYPQYLYDPEGKNPPKITGYQASNNVNIVTKKTEKVPEIIDTAISAGANRVDGPYFSLSAEAQKNLRSEVIEKAKLDAEDNAKILLEMQSLSIKGIKSMSINFGGYPVAFLERAVATGGAYYSTTQAQLAPTPYISPPPVLPGEQQVSATVAVTYIVG